MNGYQALFTGILGAESICLNEPMSGHTSFRTGGSADLLLVPQSEEELLAALAVVRQNALPCHIIGRGTNLLVSDAGIRGVVIKIAYGDMTVHGGILKAKAGVSLKALALMAAEANLGGLEFAAGIPGTLGGGVVMNAGAYGGELGEYIESVHVVDAQGEVQELQQDEMEFAYRHSIVPEKGYIVLSATLRLPRGSKAESLAKIEELAAKRRDKQPLQHPSAGSTFKRPAGQFAGALIEQCGLKGTRLGGAQVSSKHAGFVVNTGGAKSAEIYGLMCKVRDTVYKETDVLLEPEVKLLGEFPHD